MEDQPAATADTCRGCRHWTRFDLEVDPHYEVGELSLRLDVTYPSTLDDEQLREWGVCGRSQEMGGPMFTVDASGYYSSLSTLASFSCSEFARPVAPLMSGHEE